MGEVLHASKSGWFPICIQNELPPITDMENRYSGRANSLEIMMAIYWRAREWKIEYTSQTQIPSTITATGIYGFDAEKEEDLVCSPPFVEKSFISNYSGFQEHFFSILSIFANLYYGVTSLDNNQTFRYAYNTLYYGADDGTAGGAIYSGFRASEIGPSAIEQSIFVTIGNLEATPFRITKTPDLANNYASFSISVNKYWSYGGTYDTTTGLPLT